MENCLYLTKESTKPKLYIYIFGHFITFGLLFFMHIRPTACFFRHNSLNSFEAHDPTVISRILLTLDFIGTQSVRVFYLNFI